MRILSINTQNKNGSDKISPFLLGGGGIRTHGTRERTTVFKTAPINRSGTPPFSCLDVSLFYYIKIFCQDILKTIILLANIFFTIFLLFMEINNTQQKINFNGYDARKLKGFVMNSNFAGIAEEMRKIGEAENFKVYLFNNSFEKPILKTDCFVTSKNSRGCWAQDYWGIVKNSLLTCENSQKSEILKNLFNLKNNNVQEFTREILNINANKEYMDLLQNLSIIKKDGKELVKIPTPEGFEYIDKKIYDYELATNKKTLEKTLAQTHIKGGNYFITKNKQNEEELLIGKNELKKYNIEELKKMFNVKNVYPMPYADFHIDLFLRPLKDKKILISDDNTMLATLAKGAINVRNTALNSVGAERNELKKVFNRIVSCFNQFKEIVKSNPYANMNDVETALKQAGYEPIKVPSRVFEIFDTNNGAKKSFYLRQLHNYMNANVLINDKNETVYITNKSNLDEILGLTNEIQQKTGFSLEQAFLDKIRPYVDKVYFVSGENNTIAKKLLPDLNGGIHCMSMEIPE